MDCGYTIEELIPVVDKLARDFAGNETTSITYERAELLMEAVLYCIREAEENMRTESGARAANDMQAGSSAQAESGARLGLRLQNGMTAMEAYAFGFELVERKARAALRNYEAALPQFCSYENVYLADTFGKGVTAFFQRYDAKYMPQETLLTLDYPVLRDLSGMSGIDRISAYIDCIIAEQKFLGAFPEGAVVDMLEDYNPRYRKTADNLCEIVLMKIFEKTLRRDILLGDMKTLKGFIRQAIAAMAGKQCQGDERLEAYLACAADDIAVRLQAPLQAPPRG